MEYATLSRKGRVPQTWGEVSEGPAREVTNAHPDTSHQPINTPSKIVVPSDDGSRNIGIIRKRTFTKSNFHSKRHICHKHNAIGIDKRAFQDYILNYADRIDVYDQDEGVTYTVAIRDFESHCIEDDLGWGAQLFLHLSDWTKDPSRERPRQLNLALGGQAWG